MCRSLEEKFWGAGVWTLSADAVRDVSCRSDALWDVKERTSREIVSGCVMGLVMKERRVRELE